MAQSGHRTRFDLTYISHKALLVEERTVVSRRTESLKAAKAAKAARWPPDDTWHSWQHLAVFDWYLASSLTLVVLWLSHPCPSRATFGNGFRAKIHSSIGFPSMRCSCTKRGMRSAVMPRYQVPSG